MRYPVLLERKAFQKTSTPKRASVRSSSSSRALTSTTRQNRSMARFVWRRRRSHSSIEMPPFSLRSGGLPCAFAALRIEKKEPIEELDFAGGADAAVEIVKIGAAAEGDVLTIVHVL